MDFSFSDLMQDAQAAASERLGTIENLLEENLPATKSILDRLQNAQLGDWTGEWLTDLKTGKYAAAGEAVMGKYWTVFSHSRAWAQPIGAATEVPGGDDEDDDDVYILPKAHAFSDQQTLREKAIW